MGWFISLLLFLHICEIEDELKELREKHKEDVK